MSNFQNKINRQEKGIWRYADFYDEFIEKENRLSLDSQGRGSDCPKSPILGRFEPSLKPEMAYLRDASEGSHLPSRVFGQSELLLNVKHLYFKREDENSTGSLKDRSLAYQVSLAKQNKKRELVISTSGNAGIAAAAYCQKAGIKLYVFISPETEKEKVIEMQKYDPIIIKSKKAIRLANYLSAKCKIENFRPSVNDSSIEGFKSIAFEIFENLGKVNAIFTFVTSGSSFIGIGRAYKYLWETGEIKNLPKLYAIQSGNIFSIAREFGEINLEGRMNGNVMEAGKLGVKNTLRKKEIIEFINSSGGSGIYVKGNEVQKAKNILEENGIYTSLEGCASFAGAIKESAKNELDKVVCILSGRRRQSNVVLPANEIDESEIYKAESFDEVDKIVSGI